MFAPGTKIACIYAIESQQMNNQPKLCFGLCCCLFDAFYSYTIKGDQVRTHKHVLCRQRMKINMQHQRISTKSNMIITMSYVMWSRQTHGNRIGSIRAYRLANEHTFILIRVCVFFFVSFVDLNNLNSNQYTHAIWEPQSTICYCICCISSRTDLKLSFRERIIIGGHFVCSAFINQFIYLAIEPREEKKTKQT